jgi:hypothetical protein
MARETNNMKLPPVIAAYQQWIAKCLIAETTLAGHVLSRNHAVGAANRLKPSTQLWK